MKMITCTQHNPHTTKAEGNESVTRRDNHHMRLLAGNGHHHQGLMQLYAPSSCSQCSRLIAYLEVVGKEVDEEQDQEQDRIEASVQRRQLPAKVVEVRLR